MPNNAIICLGANGADAAAQLARAFLAIQGIGKVVKATPVYPSDPEFARDAAPYLNRIVEITTDTTYDSALQITKNYQTIIRMRNRIEPLVAIDIDIVSWNGYVLRPADASARYFRKGMEMLKK